MKILVFSPHPDDDVLGCGGTMARYIAEGAEVTVCIVTSPQPPVYVYRDKLIEEKGWPHRIYPEIKNAHALLGVKETVFLKFPCVLLEQQPRHVVNGEICKVVQTVKPDVVFLPHFGDMQKDHTIVSEAVMVAVRPKYPHVPRFIYSYECLSETEWSIPHAANAFLPNTFVDISEYLEKKLVAMACFTSQIGDFPNPRSIEAVESLARLRGSSSGFRAAEAFSLIREYRGSHL